MKKIKLTKNMGHTWFVDLDGTILKHNGYILDKKDTLLKGVKKFLAKYQKNKIILTTFGRKNIYKKLKIFKKKIKLDIIKLFIIYHMVSEF